jgi:hypothetical protein
MEMPLITIGFNKNDEADFSVRGDFMELTLKQLQELRALIPVAIYVAEDMWRCKQPNTASQSNKR